MAVTQYIGSRYVPLFADPIEWSDQNTYEPLTIVLHEGNSYTSKQAVPKDIAIDNEDFWAITGNYNAQVELYRRETAAAKAAADAAQETADGAQIDIDTLLPKSAFSAANTVKDNLDDLSNTLVGFSPEDTVIDYVNGAGAKYITLDELPTVGEGVYTLGTVQVDSPIQLPRTENRHIIIVDTVFNINTPILFPAYRADSYFILPSFVGCMFTNATSGRVLVTSGGNNIVASRFSGCYFKNVDMVANTGYVQDFNFTACYINSYQTFIDAVATTVQARFVNCTVESESEQLIKAQKIVAYFSGTYEGNVNKDFYFVSATYGTIVFESVWFEGCKMLELVGGTRVNERSAVYLNGCNITGHQTNTPIFTATNAQYINLYITASLFAAYNTNSRFTDLTASQFESVTGAFELLNADSYAFPIGGANAQDKAIVTLDKLSDLSINKNFTQLLRLTQAAIDAGGIDIEGLPVGGYLVSLGYGAYSTFTDAALVIVSASPESATNTAVKTLVAASAATLQGVSLTATKQNPTDTTFKLNVTSTNPVTARICMIRIY